MKIMNAATRLEVSMPRIDNTFCNAVLNKSGVNFRRCMHCLTCAAGCPVITAMPYHPNRIIRMIQLGYKKEVLESADIWLCIGCNTCAMACPQAIDIAAVMDALREIALDEKADVAEPAILSFHQAVLHSIRSYGRTHKLEIMMRHKLKQRDLFTDMDIGLKMLARRKLELLPSKIAHPDELRKLFDAIGGNG